MDATFRQFDSAMRRLLKELFRHGYGQLTVRVSVQPPEKLVLIIDFGKSHKFVIPVAELLGD